MNEFLIELLKLYQKRINDYCATGEDYSGTIMEEFNDTEIALLWMYSTESTLDELDEMTDTVNRFYHSIKDKLNVKGA